MKMTYYDYETLKKLVVEAHLGGLCKKHGVAPLDSCPECRLEVAWTELRARVPAKGATK